LTKARTTDFAPLFTWRSAICDSGLAPTTRLVALVLSLHMNERGGSCWPSQVTLSAESGLSVRAIREHLNVLEDGGWLSVELDAKGFEKRGGGRKKTTHWVANVPVNPAPETGNEVPGNEQTRHMTTENPAYDDTNPAPPAGEVFRDHQEGAISLPAEPAQPPAKVDPTAAAKAVLNPWWENPDRRPMVSKYIAILKLVQAALEGGYSPEAITSALDSVRAFTAPSLEFELTKKPKARAPGAWSTIQEIMDRQRLEAAGERLPSPEQIGAPA
jgi:hypothetical protein